MKLFKNYAIKKAGKQHHINTEEDILKYAIRKERALKYLTNYDSDSNKMDDTVDRIWFEHQPFNTIYSYAEFYPSTTLETLKKNHLVNDKLVFTMRMHEFEFGMFLDNQVDDIAIVIGTTGSIFNTIRKYFDGKFTLNISGMSIPVDLNYYISPGSVKIPREIRISRKSLNNIITEG